jgi:D-alanyl-D-alanine carboxypeptidase/D-alanyl-D-alanine-endopeptidase (penicillin-binding protein 4)
VPEERAGFAYYKQVAIGSASGLLAVVLLVLVFSLGGGSTPKPTNTQTDSASGTPTASANPTPTDGRTCSVDKLAKDKLLATFSGVVVNATTKEVLFDRNSTVGVAPASTLKLFTAAAALQTLGPNYVVDTKVFSDPSNPGTIILVGGGDPTLSATAPGKQSVYANAPKLSDLAIKVNLWAAANNVTINKIILDSTLFAGGTQASKWDSSWPASELTLGFQSQVTALQVDGDRANPYNETSPRSNTPVLNAGRKFKTALGVKGASLVEGVNPTNAVEVAKVSSQTIDKWIKHMLLVSDNTEAEYLGRLVALKLGYDGSLGSVQLAIKKSLASTNIDLTKVVIKDGSGESPQNSIAPATEAALLGLVLEGFGNFSVINQGLPISHESGSLASRFGGKNLDAAGKVRAKTGWITHGYALSGIIQARDRTNLLFAVFAQGAVTDKAKDAIDNLVTGFYRCGNTLSNQ